MARRQRILLIATFAMILLASGGAWYLFQGPDPVRGTRTSGPAAVPVTIATATIRIRGAGTGDAFAIPVPVRVGVRCPPGRIHRRLTLLLDQGK